MVRLQGEEEEEEEFETEPARGSRDPQALETVASFLFSVPLVRVLALHPVA